MKYYKPNIRESDLLSFTDLLRERNELRDKLEKFNTCMQMLSGTSDKIQVSWTVTDPVKKTAHNVTAPIGLYEMRYLIQAVNDRIISIQDKMSNNGVELGL